jgi:hypothetical protein
LLFKNLFIELLTYSQWLCQLMPQFIKTHANQGFQEKIGFVPNRRLSQLGTTIPGMEQGTREQRTRDFWEHGNKGFFGNGETPVETPFMASEVSEFVKRKAESPPRVCGERQKKDWEIGRLKV